MSDTTIRINDQLLLISELPDHIRNSVTLHQYITTQLIEATKNLGMIELAHNESSLRILNEYNTHISVQVPTDE